ncbi:flagellin [Rhizobium daejeonense]
MAGANSLYIGVNVAIHPEQGGKSDFVVSNATSSGVTAVAAEVSLPISVNFDFLDIDVTGGADVDHYIGGLEIMIGKVVNGAASLGSLQQRIGMQSDFAGKLMDSIESGVGRLIDADMEEASSRLKALQTQEQLALQSLQIANAGSENILGLFN